MFRNLRLTIRCLSFMAVSLAGAAVMAQQPFQMYFKPTPVVAGETARMVLTSPSGKVTAVHLPKVRNLSWQGGPSASMSVVNGRHSYGMIYSFIVHKPGKVIIPSFKVNLNGKNYATEMVTLNATKGALSDLESYLFIKPKYLGLKSDTVYVGEEVPMEIQVCIARGLNASPMTYPELELSNVVFDDYKSYYRDPRQCPDNRFAPYPQREFSITRDGVTFGVSTFLTSFRPISAGTISGDASIKFKISVPRSSRQARARRRSLFDDDFFGGGFGDSFFSDPFSSNAVARTVAAALPKLIVKPLPPPPEGTRFLGVIGDWNLKVELTSKELRVGTPVNLRVSINGRGSLENLNAPEITIPGFNDYAPEVERGKGGNSVAGLEDSATINYVLIPTQSGKTNLDFSVSAFNPKTGKYAVCGYNKTFDVAPAPNGLKVENYHANEEASDIAEKAPKLSQILYLKKKPMGAVQVPLWNNHLITFAILLILGPLAFAILELIRLYRTRIGNNPALRRRQDAMKRRGAVTRAIRDASAADLPNVILSEAVPFINDLKNFSPGSTVKELEARLKNQELIECLKETEALSYMPGASEQSEKLRAKILRTLKRVSVVALLLFGAMSMSLDARAALNAPSVHAQAADSPRLAPPPPVPPSSSATSNSAMASQTQGLRDNALAAYDAGDFNKTLGLMEERVNPVAPDPAWLYNVGDCYYQKGDLAKALLYFERAARLAPRDSDILQNLNLVRRQLALQERGRTRHPLDVLRNIRDSLRPDEWALLGAAAWFIGWLALAIRRNAPNQVWLSLLIAASIALVISIACWFAQRATTYNPSDAIVLERNVLVRVLPSDKAAKAKFTLTSGEEVKIEETRNGWTRVRSGKAEGWVTDNAIAKVWPY